RVPQRDVDVLAACGRGRRSRGGAAPELEPERREGGGRADGAAARVPAGGARERSEALLRRRRPDVVLRPRPRRRARGGAVVTPAEGVGPARARPLLPAAAREGGGARPGYDGRRAPE